MLESDIIYGMWKQQCFITTGRLRGLDSMFRKYSGFRTRCGSIECEWKGIMWKIGKCLESELCPEWKGRTDLSILEIWWIHFWRECGERTMGWNNGINQRRLE